MSSIKRYIEQEEAKGNDPLQASYEPPYDAEYEQWLKEQYQLELERADRENILFEEMAAPEQDELTAVQCGYCFHPLDDYDLYEESPITAEDCGAVVQFCSAYCKSMYLDEKEAQLLGAEQW